MPSPPNFKTADWRGVVRPDLAPANEVVTLPVRLPKDLADDVALVAHEYRRWFDSTDEFIGTALTYALASIAEAPPSTTWPNTQKKGARKQPRANRNSGQRRVADRRSEKAQKLGGSTQVGSDLPDEKRQLKWERIGPGNPPVQDSNRAKQLLMPEAKPELAI